MKRTLQILTLFAYCAALDWTSAAEDGPARIPWRSVVSGVVYSDENENRIFDKTDLPGKGLKVRLISLDAEEIEIATLRTDDEGGFEFGAVLEGQYRLEVMGYLKGIVKSENFEVKAGKVAPFFAIQLNSIPKGAFRGRVANPKNTEGNVISPFSPESGRNVSRIENNQDPKSES